MSTLIETRRVEVEDAFEEPEVCEYCLGEGWVICDSYDHTGEHCQHEVRCECNPKVVAEFDSNDTAWYL